MGKERGTAGSSIRERILDQFRKDLPCLFKKEEKPLVLNASGKVVPISIRRSGTELKQHYSKVADSLQKSSKLALSKEAAMKTGRLEKFPANPMKAK